MGLPTSLCIAVSPDLLRLLVQFQLPTLTNRLVWPTILIPLYWFAPESPWWYVRHDRIDEAEKVVRRLASSALGEDASVAVAAMIRTNQLELDANSGAQSSWVDCFRGTDLRRTEISALSWAAQNICGGSYAIGWVVYFFRQAGLETQDAFKMGLANTACAFVGTMLSWVLISRFGRRTIFVCGVLWLSLIHFIVGGLSFLKNGGGKWAQAALLLVWVMSYDFTIGPIAYCE